MEDTHSLHPRVTGLRQTQKAVAKGLAARVYLACDADPALTGPMAALCREQGVPVEEKYSMEELGRSAGIEVGAAVIALLR